MVMKQSSPPFTDAVAGDEVSRVAGQKGTPKAVENKGEAADADAARAHAAAAPALQSSPRSSGCSSVGARE